MWHPEKRLTDIPGQSWGPRIAAYNGVLHAVWFEYPDFNDPEIFYSRSADNGNSWTTPQNLSSHPNRQDLYPSVAADAYGVYVFWSSDVVNGEAFPEEVRMVGIPGKRSSSSPMPMGTPGRRIS